VSDDRTIDADGRCRAPVGDTVDVETASYTNTIGAPLLSTVWEDPDFDADRPAAWYVRVLEIPTPRWTTYDAARRAVALADDIPRTTEIILSFDDPLDEFSRKLKQLSKEWEASGLREQRR